MAGAIGLLPRPLAFSAFWLSLVTLSKPPGTRIFAVSGSRVDNQRNIIVREFLQTDGEWLLFLDDDHLVPEQGLHRLLAHDKDMVAGLYLTRTEPYRSAQMIRGGPDGYRSITPAELKAANPLLKVDVSGMGMTLIRRRVFEGTTDPWFKVSMGEDRRVKGEDVYFCEQAQERGFELFVDVSLPVPHLSPRGVTLDEGKVKFLSPE